MHALRHPAYSERYQHTKCRLGRQRGAKVAQMPHDRPAVAASAAPVAGARATVFDGCQTRATNRSRSSIPVEQRLE
jgi:hypothetical protein